MENLNKWEEKTSEYEAYLAKKDLDHRIEIASKLTDDIIMAKLAEYDL